MFRAIQLHDVLLLPHEQFNLDFTGGYLQGRQSIFKNVTGQLVIFSAIVSLCCVAQPDCFPPDSSKGTEKRPLPKSQCRG